MVAQQWLNNRTVYLDFAACSLHSSNQPANHSQLSELVVGGGGRQRKKIGQHSPVSGGT